MKILLFVEFEVNTDMPPLGAAFDHPTWTADQWEHAVGELITNEIIDAYGPHNVTAEHPVTSARASRGAERATVGQCVAKHNVKIAVTDGIHVATCHCGSWNASTSESETRYWTNEHGQAATNG